jgi:hypothetical protein
VFFYTKERRKEGLLKFNPSTVVGKPFKEPEGRRECFFFTQRKEGKKGFEV